MVLKSWVWVLPLFGRHSPPSLSQCGRVGVEEGWGEGGGDGDFHFENQGLALLKAHGNNWSCASVLFTASSVTHQTSVVLLADKNIFLKKSHEHMKNPSCYVLVHLLSKCRQ